MAEKNRNNTAVERTANAVGDGAEIATDAVNDTLDTVGEAMEAAVDGTVEAVQNVMNPVTERNNEDER